MGERKRSLFVAIEDDGRKLSFFYEASGAAQSAATPKEKLFELSLYGKNSAWSDDNAALVGDIVLGALDLNPRRNEEEDATASDRAVKMLAKLDDEERRGLSDVSSLRIRAELEFAEYWRSGNLKHFISGESLYERLAAAGSVEHIEIMKTWDVERERRLRRRT